jgi:DNA-binding SARP family transcriptional activator
MGTGGLHPVGEHAGGGTALTLGLLGGFRLSRDGSLLALSLGEQRLTAFLALHKRPLERAFVAGNLWIDSDDDHASGNLRTTLWRLRNRDERLIDSSRSHLSLSPIVDVDLHEATAHARCVLHDAAVSPDGEDQISFASDLLPDWYDDWVLIERERFRQLRLHALEAQCTAFESAGAYGLALEAGLACVAAEPLRESAHRALIRIHMAEGNPAEAVRQYRLYRGLIMDELGLSPSLKMEQMVQSLTIRDAVVTEMR